MVRHTRAGWSLLAAALLLAGLPAVALAHPLGNFTINHYAGIRVEPDRIRLDVVVDRAEIPTFQARLDLDTDGDGVVSPAETDAARVPACRTLSAELELSVDGHSLAPDLVAAGLDFPPGAGGLSTMRLVCELSAPIEGGIADGRRIAFADRSFPDRLGWREIVAEGDGTTVDADGTALGATMSNRLTDYPAERLGTPLAMRETMLLVTPGGATLPAWRVPDASPLEPSSVETRAPVGARPAAGGFGSDLPAVFSATDMSPSILLLAVATALALGAGHALTPGHGKSVMAAYLVGTRGTALHALGLGVSVTVAHTLGILTLAALVVAAQGALAPDVVVRAMPVLAALTIVAIGGWMLATELRRRQESMPTGAGHGHDHAHGHLQPPAATVTWRSLFALGLAGGIVPSTSALLILLGSVAAGRPAFGLVLLVAFGLGMALVLVGLGVVLVKGRAVVERLRSPSPLGEVAAWAPLGAAVVVLSMGLWLTVQAVTGAPPP